MARARRKPELQREGQVRCRFCGGFYDPSLPECPNCGSRTEENQSFVTDWATIGPEACAGGFGGPRSSIQTVAKWFTGLLAGLLAIVAVISVGKVLSSVSAKQPVGQASASISTPTTASDSNSASTDTDKQKAEEEATAAQTKAEEEQKEKEEAAKKKAEEEKKNAPESLALSYDDLTMRIDETLTLELTIQPNSWKGDVKWSTSDQYVAWVDQDGTITCKGGGECQITVNASGKTIQCRVLCHDEVSDHDAVDAWVKEHTAELTAQAEAAKKEKEEAAAKKAAEEKKKQEEAEKKAAAEKAKEEEAKKQAEEEKKKEEEAKKKAEEEKKEKAAEEKKKKTSDMKLDLDDMTLLDPGDSYDLTATGGDGRYTWSSDNKSVATVDKNGVVTAVSQGTCNVTCKDGSGNSVTCIVRIRN